MKKAVLSFISFVIWVALTFRVDPVNIAEGIAVSLLIGSFFGDALLSDFKGPFKPKRALFALFYAAVFLYRALIANIVLTIRVFGRDPEVGQKVIKVKTKFKNDEEMLLFAIAETFSPSTMFVSSEGADAYLFVMHGPTKHVRSAEEDALSLDEIIKGVFQ